MRRRRKGTIQTKVSLPKKLFVDLELSLFDQSRDREGESYPKRMYGLRSRVITGLLERWLKEGANLKIATSTSD
jgi:hypothetical protein